MLNPKQLVVGRKKIIHPDGTKAYLFGFSGFRAGRRIFKTASEAMQYGVRFKARWIRLYDAAMLAMVSEAV